MNIFSLSEAKPEDFELTNDILVEITKLINKRVENFPSRKRMILTGLIQLLFAVSFINSLSNLQKDKESNTEIFINTLRGLIDSDIIEFGKQNEH